MNVSGHTFLDAKILVVDDAPDNVTLVAHFLKFAGYTNIRLVTDSSLVMDTVRTFGPDLILLDLHMPEFDGFQILKMLHEGGFDGKFIPVLVFTADITPGTRTKALEAGASDFLTKPGDAAEILLRVRNFLHSRKLHLDLERSRQLLEDRVWARTADLSLARREALEALARAAEFQDNETSEHTMRVGELSARISERMGQPNYFVEAIRLAAPLHDIGKVAVPDAILYKTTELDLDEQEAMRLHTVAGERILARAASPLMIMARSIAKSHHERWDGKGYPIGLSGEAIPFEGRVVAVADAYDGLVLGGSQISHEDAVAWIRTQSGGYFDPAVVEAFAALDVEELKKAA